MDWRINPFALFHFSRLFIPYGRNKQQNKQMDFSVVLLSQQWTIRNVAVVKDYCTNGWFNFSSSWRAARISSFNLFLKAFCFFCFLNLLSISFLLRIISNICSLVYNPLFLSPRMGIPRRPYSGCIVLFTESWYRQRKYMNRNRYIHSGWAVEDKSSSF